MRAKKWAWRVTCDGAGNEKPFITVRAKHKWNAKRYAKDAIRILRECLGTAGRGCVILEKWSNVYHKWRVKKLYWV